jgi:uncharacterized protein (DUF1330 family)
MPAFVIAEVEVTDTETYDVYRQQVGATVQQYGGRFIIRGGTAAALEGDGPRGRIVVLEFPDMAALKAWYDSPEYAGPKQLRFKSATSRVITVDA